VEDDETIEGAAILWRRIPSFHVILDGRNDRCRASKAAFDDSDDGSPMSAYLVSEEVTAAKIIEGLEGFSVVKFTAQVARGKGLGISRDPLPEAPNHVLVFGKKTDSTRRALATGSTWEIPPPVDQCKRVNAECLCVPRQ
jgi:hypothetical protein